MSIVKLRHIHECEIDSYLNNNSCITDHLKFSLQAQRVNFTKKLITISGELENASFDVFSEFNRRGRSFVIDPQDLFCESVRDNVSFILEKELRHLERADDWLTFIGKFGDFGTGSSVGTEQNYACKQISDKLTYSSPSTLMAYKWLCKHRSSCFRSTELERQANHGCAKELYGSCTFVPKDTSKYRMVVTEPSLDMFFQRGLGVFIDSRLASRYGIVLSEQERINKHMARVGSITGKLSTIDSKSASDSIYLEPLLEANVIPKWFGALVREIKSPLVKYKKKVIKISMIGTQGCGFTFSFMTFFLASIVESVYSLLGIPVINGSTFAVYGDDVIVRSDAYDRVTQCMAMFGFVVNMTKSFKEGPFRESCGGDYYRGNNTRSFYLKRLVTRQDYAVCFNGLLLWCSRNGVILYETLSYLAKRCGSFRVPYYENWDSGFHCMMRGNYKAWLPKKPSRPMPECHYDARVQMAIKGYIDGTRLLCRRKGDYTEYFVKNKYCAVLGQHSAALGDSTFNVSQYVLTLERVWTYIDYC